MIIVMVMPEMIVKNGPIMNDLSASTPGSMETVIELVKVVSRSFYEDKYSVFLDFLIRERMLPDDVLSERMQIMIKEVNKIASRLREDRLIRTETRQEERSYDGKMINRTYFYIDYPHFVDVVKFKLYRMRKTLDDKLKNELSEKSYFCNHCKKTYGALDVSRLINPRTTLFECETCGSELESIDATALSGGNKAHSKLIEQTNNILRILKRLDDETLPSFDPVEYLRIGEKLEFLHGVDGSSTEAISPKSPELKTAGHDTPKELQVEIIASSTLPKEAHELPVWHTHSTITGVQVKTQFKDSNAPIMSPQGQVSSIDFDKYYSSIQNVNERIFKRVKAEKEERENEGENEGVKSLAPEKPTTIMVSVNGIQKPIEEITENDKNNMTETEYLEYYEAYASLDH